MLPAPTTETVLIMALLAAHTAPMSAKKCSRFRRSTAIALTFESKGVTIIRKTAPSLDASREGASTLLRTGCVICPRRKECPAPVE